MYSVVLKERSVRVLGVLIRFLRDRASAACVHLGGVRRSERSQGRQSLEMWAPQARDWPTRDRGGSAGAEEPPLVEDSSFAQLVEYARDPERMREVLQRHLQPVDKGTYWVRECEVSHVCYRHATHCVVLYTLRLGEPTRDRSGARG